MIQQINGQWRIASDKYQFILQKKRASPKADGSVRWHNESYHPDIPGLVKTLVYHDFRSGEAETLIEALNRVEKLVTDVQQALAPIIKVEMVNHETQRL